jgi:DNA polymerase III subunit gamma/tau
MSLDTKYRPRNFDDVLGQDGIITILRRYIVTGRSLHQSYLFAGPFGSGKTTLGRIMARALMCEAPRANGDPCDVCSSCVSILETGNSMDFIEVDAATNSGKADVQKITEEIQYSTFAGRRRIYLFDEAHQLSKDALDALLKPLEENVPGTQEKRLVCIFCTTEPEKMKATIFSRCAPTFVIQPVVPSDIAKRLAYVCDQEGFEYDMDMLQVIAEMTECHIRDALKSVEGVSMLGKLDRANVAKYLKLDMNLMFIDTLENLGKDLGKAIGFAKEAMLRSSPATCYEKLATMAMMAYQVGIGALKAPSYIEAGRLEGLFAAQQHSLIGFASRFSSRVGRPTESMLLCDLGSLHYGGSAVGNAQIVMVQNQSSTRSEIPATVNRQPPMTGKVNAPPPSGGAAQRADVRTNPKAVGGYQPPPLEHLVSAKGVVSEIDPAMFGFLLAMQIAHFEGMPSGPTGRSDMGGH